MSPKPFNKELWGIYFDSIGQIVYAVGANLNIVRYGVKDSSFAILHDEPTRNLKLNSIEFNKDNSIGIAVGQESTVLISENRGKTWKEIPAIDTDFASFSDVAVLNGCFYIVGEKGRLYKSNKTANKWERITVGDSTEDLIAIAFSKKANIGFITSSTSKCRKHLYRTEDAGLHWIEESIFLTITLKIYSM